MVNYSMQQMIPQIQGYLAGQPISKAWLFGSYSRGEETANSDIDLLVDFNKEEIADYFDNFFELKYALEALLGRSVDLVEEKNVRNPYFKKSIDNSKALIYG